MQARQPLFRPSGGELIYRHPPRRNAAVSRPLAASRSLQSKPERPNASLDVEQALAAQTGVLSEVPQHLDKHPVLGSVLLSRSCQDARGRPQANGAGPSAAPGWCLMAVGADQPDGGGGCGGCCWPPVVVNTEWAHSLNTAGVCPRCRRRRRRWGRWSSRCRSPAFHSASASATA